MESSDILTVLVEGLASETIFDYEDAPLTEAQLVSARFKDLKIGGIVAQEGAIANPQKTLDLVLENQKDGMGFITNPARSTLILIETRDDGGANLYYSSKDPTIVQELEAAFGSSVDTDPGMFFLESSASLTEIIESSSVDDLVIDGYNADGTVIEEEVIPEPVVSTMSETSVDSEPNFGTGTVVGNTIFSVLTIVVLLWVAFSIWGVFKKPVDKEVLKVFFKSKKSEESVKPAEWEVKNVLGKDVVAAQIEVLSKNIGFHERLLKARAANLSRVLENIRKDFLRLWELTKEEGVDNSVRQRLSIEYTDVFNRFNRLSGEGYWGDLIANPQDYRDPRDANTRLNEVRKTANSVEEMILDNIRQLKENSTLEFDVDLQLLNKDGKIEKELFE